MVPPSMEAAVRSIAGLACPACHGALVSAAEGWTCVECGGGFGRENGVPNFIVGDRFPDTAALEVAAYEERANEACARRWYVPTIARLTAGMPRGRVRVASVGCGTGVDVEVLADAGFDAVGFDCGHRNQTWPRRRCADRLLLASGLHAPFRDGWFDVVIMGCVFPHVGAVGDSFQVAPRYHEDRLALAREMARIVRAGGHVLVSSPNRRFAFDLFHRHDPHRRVPRRNPARARFLLSLTDYRALFVEGAGCRGIEALSIVDYWGFVNMDISWRTRLLRRLLRTWFQAVSAVPRLRSGPLAPWLCLDVVR